MPEGLLLVLGGAAAGGAAFFGAYGLGAAWDALARRHVSDLTPSLRALRLDAARLPLYLRLWGAGVAAVFLVGWLVLGALPLAAAAALLAYGAPRFLLRQQLQRRRL